MSLTSYRAAPPRGGMECGAPGGAGGMGWGPAGPGGDLLFRALGRSTIGAEGFHGRVRDGIGCLSPRYGHQAGQAPSPDAKPLGRRRGGVTWRRLRRRPPALSRGACRWARAVKGNRAISTGRLERIAPLPPPAYRRDGLSRLSARPGFEEGFPLRCLQRLSRPHLATRRCGGRHNRYTRGASLPVLSY